MPKSGRIERVGVKVGRRFVGLGGLTLNVLIDLYFVGVGRISPDCGIRCNGDWRARIGQLHACGEKKERQIDKMRNKATSSSVIKAEQF